MITHCFSFLLLPDMVVHDFKLSTLLIIILFLKIKPTKALVKCNETVTKLQLCSLADKYQKGVPPGCKDCKPMNLSSSLTVFKIAELDENQNTVTLNLLLSVVWNDTRVTLESNDPDE